MSTNTSSTTFSSIAQVEQTINAGPLPPDILGKLSAFELLFIEQSPIQRRCLYMKKIYGEQPAVVEEYEKKREKQLAGGSSDKYRVGYERTFQDINRDQGGCFDNGQIHRFLDLGCSPGGFSTWLLKHNGAADGLGITLSNEDAPYEFSITGTDMVQPRYQVRFDSVIEIAMQAIEDGNNPLVPLTVLEDDPKSYDLIIAGAFPTLAGRVPWWLRVQLVLSQLLIVFGNISERGACVIVVNTKTFRWLVEIIGLLRRSFEVVRAVKGSLHEERSSCYIVCRGFIAQREEIAEYTGRLRDGLKVLTQVREKYRVQGESGLKILGVSEVSPDKQSNGHPEKDMPRLFPFLADSDKKLFEHEHQFVLRLFEPLWESQYTFIREKLEVVLKSQAPSSLPWRRSGSSTQETPPNELYRSSRGFSQSPTARQRKSNNPAGSGSDAGDWRATSRRRAPTNSDVGEEGSWRK